MKIYIVMHSSYNDYDDCTSGYEQIAAVCLTKEIAIEYIKTFNTDDCWELDKNYEYTDTFDEVTGERMWDGDWYGERLYIEEWEAKES